MTDTALDMRPAAKPVPAKRAVAGYDSSSSMLRALALCLHDRDTPVLGIAPASVEPFADPFLKALDRLPRGAREALFTWGGIAEALPLDRFREVDAEAIAEWLVERYPRRPYPAIFIGSSNGALIHLAAALGCPWLPQTLLLPVRRRYIHMDEPREIAAETMGAARGMLDANPNVALHQMHDPVQDRLPVRRMSYFRMKYLRLPNAYRRFLDECLALGGRIIIANCEYAWPTTQLADRHVFQFGGVGGANFDDLFRGTPAVREFLSGYGSHRERWDPPEPDAERVEAEWGFREELRADITAYAEANHRKVQEIRFKHPMEVSGPVADLHRWWYQKHGTPIKRLLVEQFVYVEPWWAPRLGAVPFWTLFGTEPSWRRLVDYLRTAPPYDDMRIALFSHGTFSIGMATGSEWQGLLSYAKHGGGFVGTDPGIFPLDVRTIVGFHRDVSRLDGRVDPPPPLTLQEADEFFASAAPAGVSFNFA
ncbi:MAG TPA: hypothetical protein VFH57_01960 [Gammaproteobacteria bacterium]|nr:hypothetical protein [Gammaproteobacteria bacterium]